MGDHSMHMMNGSMDHSVHMNHMHHMNHGMPTTTPSPTTVDHSMMDHGSGHSAVIGHESVHDHSKMDHGSHGANTHDMMMMQMWFYFGTEVTILFKEWHVTTVGGLIGSMFGIMIFAMLYEGLKYGREYLFRKSIQQTSVCNGTDRNNLAANAPVQYMEQIMIPPRMKIFSQSHLLQTLLHMLQFIMSYFLMLIFMTYNSWLCIACVVGSGLGYLIFGWRKSVVVDITEHCH